MATITIESSKDISKEVLIEVLDNSTGTSNVTKLWHGETASVEVYAGRTITVTENTVAKPMASDVPDGALLVQVADSVESVVLRDAITAIESQPQLDSKPTILNKILNATLGSPTVAP